MLTVRALVILERADCATGDATSEGVRDPRSVLLDELASSVDTVVGVLGGLTFHGVL